MTICLVSFLSRTKPTPWKSSVTPSRLKKNAIQENIQLNSTTWITCGFISRYPGLLVKLRTLIVAGLWFDSYSYFTVNIWVSVAQLVVIFLTSSINTTRTKGFTCGILEPHQVFQKSLKSVSLSISSAPLFVVALIGVPTPSALSFIEPSFTPIWVLFVPASCQVWQHLLSNYSYLLWALRALGTPPLVSKRFQFVDGISCNIHFWIFEVWPPSYIKQEPQTGFSLAHEGVGFKKCS